jgi:hypothetical protein
MSPSLVQVSKLSLLSRNRFVQESSEMRICRTGCKASDFGQYRSSHFRWLTLRNYSKDGERGAGSLGRITLLSRQVY